VKIQKNKKKLRHGMDVERINEAVADLKKLLRGVWGNGGNCQ